MNNTCDNYVQREDHTGTGLKPCLNEATHLLVYYNEFEDLTKHFYLCNYCHTGYSNTNHEYITSEKSKIIELEELK